MYRDDYPTGEQTYATLRIYHDDLDPGTVSDLLAVPATRSWRRGDNLNPPRRRPRYAPTGAWLLETRGATDSKDARRHVDWLLDRVEPRGESLAALQARGFRVDISCYWLSAQGHGGPTLSPGQMGRLAELGVDLWFDVYLDADAAANEARAPRTEPPAGWWAEPDYRVAHRHSARHRDEVQGSDRCGCFHCLSVFSPEQIVQWTDRGETALCPKCGIDSVIGSNAGFPLTDAFLGKMRESWFRS